MLRIILSGCMGRVGHAISELVEKTENVEIVAGIDKMAASSTYAYPVYTEPDRCKEKADVVIDFSRPDALPMLLRYAQKNHAALVLASTGYNQNDLKSIEYAAENVAIMRSPNMSLGINLLKKLSAEAAALLNASFDIEIIEKHHSAKEDAPSGTAMMLADSINEAAGGDLEYVYDRHERRMARPKRELGLHAVRGGTITGEHTVVFAGPDEVIELTHHAYSRQIYALGALKAAEFISTLPCGLYDMSSLVTQKQIITSAYASDADLLISVHQIHDHSLVGKIFRELKNADIMVDVINQTLPQNGVFSLTVSVPTVLAEKAVHIIEGLLNDETLEITEDVAKVTVEGSGMAHHAGAASDVIGSLVDLNIPIYVITTSETKITCCIPKARTNDALAALKKCFTIEG